MSCNRNTEALRAQLLLLLRTNEPPAPDLVALIESLSDFQLVEQIELVENVQVQTLAHLRAIGEAMHIH